MLISKNVIFNENSFANSKTAIGFMASNESESGLRSWFRVSVGPAHKMRQTLTVNFIVCLEKCDFLEVTSNIFKLYTIGSIFRREY